MKIEQRLLTPNDWSRPQLKIRELKAIVIHWTANPNASAKQNWLYFEAKKTGMGGYGSAHYIIGQDGEIIQAIPDDEIAYHCGTDKEDPESRQIYTDYARRKFKHYAIDNHITSPNFCTIGVELCPTDDAGHFTDDTVKSAIDLCVHLCRKHNLTADDITTHHEIVGWKDCPRLWTNQPELLDAFRESVADALLRQGV